MFQGFFIFRFFLENRSITSQKKETATWSLYALAVITALPFWKLKVDVLFQSWNQHLRDIGVLAVNFKKVNIARLKKWGQIFFKT